MLVSVYPTIISSFFIQKLNELGLNLKRYDLKMKPPYIIE